MAMADYTAIRKLAEDAIDEAQAYRRGEGRDPGALVAYHTAAGPEAFLNLLDRVKELEAEVDRLRSLDCDLEMLHSKHGTNVVGLMVERDEAREAVKRLAYAVDVLLSGDRDCDVIAVGILNDDVVKRIVEGE